jgi:hypothetical protein
MLHGAGRVKRPSISNVCDWVKNSWQQVGSETIVMLKISCTTVIPFNLK